MLYKPWRSSISYSEAMSRTKENTDIEMQRKARSFHHLKEGETYCRVLYEKRRYSAETFIRK